MDKSETGESLRRVTLNKDADHREAPVDKSKEAGESVDAAADAASNHHSRNSRRDLSEKRSRPKRNRKRPRSTVHSNDNVKIKTTIKRLEMDGRPILDQEGGTEQFIRVVHPYPYTFSSFAKQRWVGRTILDVYVSEFGSYPESYYRAAILQGRILVSDNKVDVDYKIQGKDVLTHIVHRHEPGVAVHPSAGMQRSIQEPAANSTASTGLIKIIDETDELIVCDKAGSLPIHPCGGYHLNSLTSILEGEEATVSGQSTMKFFNIHRLDRLTSGLVILAKSSEVAKHWSKCIRQRDCQKYYLARVRGKFPLNLERVTIDRLKAGPPPQDGEWIGQHDDDGSTPIEKARRQNAHCYWVTEASSAAIRNDVSLSEISNSKAPVDRWLQLFQTSDMSSYTNASSMLWLHLACPTRISKPKNGVCEAGPFHDLADGVYMKTVKPAQTSFGIVSYDEKSDSTLLLCRPVTGRTHQIRLHCQYLGHAIANDPNYGGDIWYNNTDGKDACAKARALLGNSIAEGEKLTGEDEDMDRSTADVPASEAEINQLSDVVQKEGESAEEFIKRSCVWCARIAGREVADHSMLEFLLRSRGIWLHALQYCIGVGQSDDGNSTFCSFRADLPSWAKSA